MKITIEYTQTGPLAHQATLAQLEHAAHAAITLDDADRAVSAILGLATYRGGSHIAIHPTWRGRFSNGSNRLAIITA